MVLESVLVSFFYKCHFLLQVLEFSSVQFSHSVVSSSLRPHESQHARPPCPSPTPGVYSNSCPSSWWCHPAISSSVVPSSSCPQSLLASGSFPMSQLFASGGQSIGVSASASVFPRNTQDWSPLGWTGWISLQSKGLTRVFFNTTVQKHRISSTQLSSQSNSHIHTYRPLIDSRTILKISHVSPSSTLEKPAAVGLPLDGKYSVVSVLRNVVLSCFFIFLQGPVVCCPGFDLLHRSKWAPERCPGCFLTACPSEHVDVTPSMPVFSICL